MARSKNSSITSPDRTDNNYRTKSIFFVRVEVEVVRRQKYMPLERLVGSMALTSGFGTNPFRCMLSGHRTASGFLPSANRMHSPLSPNNSRTPH